MAGTKAGGLLAGEQNKKRHGADYYARIGAIGGRAGKGLKGFAVNRELASRAGKLGGQISRRRPKLDK